MLARQRRVLISIRDKLGVDDHMTSIAIILYILKRFNLKYTSVRASPEPYSARYTIPWHML